LRVVGNLKEFYGILYLGNYSTRLAGVIMAAVNFRWTRKATEVEMEPITPKLTVDAVVLANDGVVLIKRKNPPFEGMWALPGGFVDVGETTEAACIREVEEETGLLVEIVRLLGVYSEPSRDPRGHSVSAVYIVKPVGGELRADTDAADVRIFPDPSALELGFDHKRILMDAGMIKRVDTGGYS
jgi:8-oxo-dGTP diphosphatase